MKGLLLLVAGASLVYGLWAHDWVTIVAGTVMIGAWPALRNDLERRRQLDRLWNDDDLSESA